ncbi:hypothetical protein CDAR_436841 [Caerostris darwini]|uniref:Uncharacterized protein n=1 Tax=Caerostris darwini TaxID=1538125 RepID=A0AAV4TA03_9ARAC|nr:hypothetical protein CDAR_436841 [Caerostris darwini]
MRKVPHEEGSRGVHVLPEKVASRAVSSASIDGNEKEQVVKKGYSFKIFGWNSSYREQTAGAVPLIILIEKNAAIFACF